MSCDEIRAWIKVGAPYVVLCLFAGALILPAAYISRNAFRTLDCASANGARGWFFLLMGPLGIFVFQFGWFANPLIAAAAFLPARFSRTKLILAVIAAAVAATSFGLKEVPNDVAVNRICGFGPGFYLWLVCPVVMAIAILFTDGAQKLLRNKDE